MKPNNIKTILMLFALITAVNAYAQTTVSGNISSDTTWTHAGSPYIVINDLTVDSGATLIIEPGVEVQIEYEKNLIIEGILRAIGTPASTIHFTKIPQHNNHGDITFDDSSTNYNFITHTGCILQYCIIEYGAENTMNYGSAVEIFNSAPLIDNCVIRYNSSNAVYVSNNNNNNDSVVITNNIIAEQQHSFMGPAAIECMGNGNVSYNVFYHNQSNDAVSIHGDIHFTNNILINNDNEGGYVFSFNDNTVVTNNTIIDNNAYPADIIRFNSINAMKNNTITRNKFYPSGSTITNISLHSTYHNNNIYGNSVGSSASSIYELKNLSAYPDSAAINAKNNWWGTTDTSAINKLIRDWHDNATYGKVDYIPFLTSPDTSAPLTPPVNVAKYDIGNGHVKVSWDASHETDLAGYKIYWGNFTGYSFTNSVDVGNVTNYTLTGIGINEKIGVTAYDISKDNIRDQFDGHESWFTYADTLHSTAAICMVTVDSASGENILVWEKENDPDINSYNLYKESTIAGVYNLMANQSANMLSTYLDHASNPAQHTEKYRIATVNTNGNEIRTSSFHQPIHLAINAGVNNTYNLIWTEYVGFSFPTYYIYKGSTAGSFQLYDSVSASFTQFTDTAIHITYYMIGIKKQIPCNPSKEVQNLYNTVISNIVNNKSMGIDHVGCNTKFINIYSVNNNIFIEMYKKGDYEIEIRSSSGNVVYNNIIKNENMLQLDISGYSKGLYIVKVNGSNISERKKIIRY